MCFRVNSLRGAPWNRMVWVRQEKDSYIQCSTLVLLFFKFSVIIVIYSSAIFTSLQLFRRLLPCLENLLVLCIQIKQLIIFFIIKMSSETMVLEFVGYHKNICYRTYMLTYVLMCRIDWLDLKQNFAWIWMYDKNFNY